MSKPNLINKQNSQETKIQYIFINNEKKGILKGDIEIVGKLPDNVEIKQVQPKEPK